MPNVDELRARYDQLVIQKNNKRKDYEEYRTQAAVVDARLREVEEEARQMGIGSFEELDKAIASEEQAIQAGLDLLEAALKGTAQIEQLPVEHKEQPKIEVLTDIDALLIKGSTGT